MGGRLIHEFDLYTSKYGKSLKSFMAELWKTLLNSQKTKESFDIN